MTGPRDHARFEELAVGHALSALEPEEEQVFLQHLASCAGCERDVHQHQETLTLLALSTDPAEPPPSVLEGIRAGIVAEGHTAPPSAPPSAPPPLQPQGVTPLAEARQRRAGRTIGGMQWVGAAAAAALVLSLGAWNLALRSDRDASEQYGDRLAAAVRDLAQPDSTSVPLQSEDGSVVAVAVVQDSEVSLVVDGLEPNDRGTTYVLWAQDRTGSVRPVGAFDVEQSQVDVVEDLPVEGGVESVTAYLVSNEQGDEAPPTPGGPVLASGET
ncbi:MAG: anti-sigma factor [Actinomycetota bacterium]|nr:anti-sigma factor [Actinomycetota bacterium]